MAKDPDTPAADTLEGGSQPEGRARGQGIEQGSRLAMTAFIGRRQLLTTARRMLSDSRLVTFTGPAGVGKTRVALKVGSELRRAFPAGVFLVELDETAAEDVADAVYAALLGEDEGAREPDPLSAVAARVHGQQCLLILDTCDHVVEACASLALDLLSAVPYLRLIVTSRQPLGIAGENMVPVPPMALPPPGPLSREMLVQFDALAFFVERATAYQPDFDIDSCDLDTIVELCRSLDGLPLALELAAARLPVLTVRQIVQRLDQRFELLVAKGAHLCPRHRSLRAAVQWSHDLCLPAEQLMWARLSVFTEGFELETAEDVCSGDPISHAEVFDLIAALVEKSVVARDETQGISRYRLLNTVRLYGQERLIEANEVELMAAKRRTWCLALAKDMELGWLGPDQADWRVRLEVEHRNIIDTLEYCLDNNTDPSATTRLAAAFWEQRLYTPSLTQGRAFLERALAQPGATKAVQARGHRAGAVLSLLQGDWRGAHRHLDTYAFLASELRDPAEDARLQSTLGLAHIFDGEYQRAANLLRESLTTHRLLGQREELALASMRLAECEALAGRPQSTEHSRFLFEQPPSAYWFHSHSLYIMALVRYHAGALDEARQLLQEAIRLTWSFQDLWGLAMCLEVFCWVETRRHPDERAAQLLAVAQYAWLSGGVNVAGLLHVTAHRGRAIAALQAALAHEKYSAASDMGQVRSLEWGVGLALEQLEPRPQQLPDTEKLTPREQQVATLVAAGLTNKEIASRLVIAQRTAETHVEHILAKLGFTSRAQIATWVTRYHKGREQQVARGEDPFEIRTGRPVQPGVAHQLPPGGTR
ncbi:LuxR C-terminal-related transcriptional regulator [Kitasatospora sp. GAS1066B]|uniref:ATP-binding protein n=1 Tax=Kitasatospora sp. GAS1066B TaxID=3156271 RepID=UPI003514304B